MLMFSIQCKLYNVHRRVYEVRYCTLYNVNVEYTMCTYFLTTTLHAVFSIILYNVTRMQSVDTVQRTVYVRRTVYV